MGRSPLIEQGQCEAQRLLRPRLFSAAISTPYHLGKPPAILARTVRRVDYMGVRAEVLDHLVESLLFSLSDPNKGRSGELLARPLHVSSINNR